MPYEPRLNRSSVLTSLFRFNIFRNGFEERSIER
jgi:hypothetical protein